MAWQQESAHAPASIAARRHAKTLRKTMTEAEKKLWWHLRYRLALEGSHFRRQVAIGSYVADFLCLGSRLIIEVDGDHHGSDGQRPKDMKRDAFLAEQDFRILRFSNREVMTEINTVLDTVRAHLSLKPNTSGPAPKIAEEKDIRND
jgi:very-short-patch-repair endonuclease